MNIHHYKLLASAALFLSFTSCVLDRSPIVSFTDLTPREYCPGDELTASYDFLREASCPAGVDCNPYLPAVSMRSEPELFTPRNFTSYRESFTFPSSGDSVTLVTTAPATVNIPTAEFRDGGRVFISRTGYTVPERRTARLFSGGEQTFTHSGMCAGASPAYSGGEFRAAPTVSARLQANEICNRSSVPIAVMVFDDMSRNTELLLGNTECRSIAAPGVIFGTPVRFSVRPQIPDITARCTATMSSPPSMALATAVRYACRP
jgi:hypothetical protein